MYIKMKTWHFQGIWFAWHPIVIHEGHYTYIVWLEKVKKKFLPDGEDSCFRYNFLHHGGTGKYAKKEN